MRYFTRRQYRFTLSLAVVGSVLVLNQCAGLTFGAPVRTILGDGVGTQRFITDLARLWRNRSRPTEEWLAGRIVAAPDARLRALARGRGDFAVIDVATASRRLSDYGQLTAIAALWPRLLHAVSRNRGVKQVALPIGHELWVLDNAAYAHRLLMELTRGKATQRRRIHRVPSNVLLESLDYAREPVVLFAAPRPLQELAEALRRDATLRLLPFAGTLLEEFKLAYPWLVTAKVGRGSYPNLARNLELPAQYLILVGRKDLPDPTVRKMIRTLYRRNSAAALINPLFGMIDGSMNAVFAELMPYHPVTARAFGFTPSLR